MTSTEMLSTYQALSELTGSMLIAASQGEWDAVATLEARCRDHIGSLQQTGNVALSAGEQRAKVAIVRAILQNDARIRALAEPRLHELQERLSQTRQGQRGMKAYHAHRL
ncbi:MAG: flagellar protein FliT [Thiobacillus sp.]